MPDHEEWKCSHYILVVVLAFVQRNLKRSRVDYKSHRWSIPSFRFNYSIQIEYLEKIYPRRSNIYLAKRSFFSKTEKLHVKTPCYANTTRQGFDWNRRFQYHCS